MPFPKLADPRCGPQVDSPTSAVPSPDSLTSRHAPSTYEPNTFKYGGPYPPRHAWIQAFRATTTEFQSRAAADSTVPDAPAAAARFAARYLDALQALEDPPAEGAGVWLAQGCTYLRLVAETPRLPLQWSGPTRCAA